MKEVELDVSLAVDEIMARLIEEGDDVQGIFERYFIVNLMHPDSRT